MFRITGIAVVVLVGLVAFSPRASEATHPGPQCLVVYAYRDCFSLSIEFTDPNGGAAIWTDANYNPSCITHRYIRQAVWFFGPSRADGLHDWSSFGHQSCLDDGHFTGGQYWVASKSQWDPLNLVRTTGYLFETSVSTEQQHRYEIRTNGNGTQTFQIDSTQLYTGGGFNWTSGTDFETGVEAIVYPTSDVLPISARYDSAMQIIPASCGCNNVYQYWTGAIGGPGCNNPSGVTPDQCIIMSPLAGQGLTNITYEYWGN